MKWELVNGTNVETKTFYVIGDNGKIGLAQVIYSDVMGVRTTAQFSSKIYSNEAGKPHLWASDSLNNFSFSKDKQSFKADNCAMDMSEDGKSYHIKSSTNKTQVVDLKFTQATPGFVVGKDGTSTFGTDPAHPWGKMYHKFWPRCNVEGTIMTKEGPVDFKGKGVFIHALQGMKPHFAAAKWNFCYFQTPMYTAIMMEYTTPPSYGETKVNVGGIVKDGEVIFAGASPLLKAEHTEIKGDPDNDWPEPSAVAFAWDGKTKDGKELHAEVKGALGPRTDRVDVMGEVPKFVKQIVAGAAGTKPYIYQYTPKLKLKLNIGGEEQGEEGQLFMEATFIS
ncbi:Survival factor 1 [Fulvia fulva]|uniref:Ceramide-binding protein SVF1 n=1 Tax=Passalora fulva TaxID=5499 RepID=A0A9Q8PDN5_PASFU|nr:Survival factor 1 [Fulvia fulva]KAK4617867.1 Survival factor 1 [Fulvia fulva]KAK4618867.1 Survival factor 1 [Fulvia fulva]UJO20548.1 Survival factor 1 [Fulvia fulva]WPV17817.1 Survival factor 1 [Fulvia fulva]WPV33547.1 Survival factor 1 [Fulvia fulva]